MLSAANSKIAASLLAFASALRAPGDDRPNIVLYFPDTISAESMPLYGNPITHTPNFDSFFASGATLFDVAYASYPQCSPSRAALITGRHIHTLGHRTMTHLVRGYEKNLFQMLKANGYQTLHFGKGDLLSQDAWNQSFTYWQDTTGVSQGGSPYSYGEQGYYSFMAGSSNDKGSDPSKNGDLRAVLQAMVLVNSSAVTEPWALFLPGLGAHPPYGMPKDYADLYDPAVIKAKFPLRSVNDTVGKPPYYGQKGIRDFRNYTTFGEDFSYQVAAQYFARVTYTDYIFGRLLSSLEETGLANRTAVVFSSDHGDFMGNYGLVEKWSGSGDDLLLQVPLAVRLPGSTGNNRVPAPVQTFDLLPTFMELAGAGDWLCSTSNVTGYVQFGNSLLPWMAPQAPVPEEGIRLPRLDAAPVVHDYVYAEAGYEWQNERECNDPTQNATWTDPKHLYYPRGQEEAVAPGHSIRLVAMRNASFKMVYRARGSKLLAPGEAPVSELYDLTTDPRQMTNVWGQSQFAGVQAQMLGDLLDWFVLTGDVTPTTYDPRNPAPSPPLPTAADYVPPVF